MLGRIMWRALLLVTHATCEWVEISQQHYRKPARTQATTAVYVNQTISHMWSDHRNIGTRVEGSRVTDRLQIEKDIVHDMKKLDGGKKQFVATVEKLTNFGVQLLNSPVKSLNVESTSAINKLSNNYKAPLENLDGSRELHQRIFYNKRKQMYTTEATVNTDISKITLKNYSLIIYDDEPNHLVSLNTKISTNDNNWNNFRFKNEESENTRHEKVTKISIKAPPDKTTRNKPNIVNSEEVLNFVTTEDTFTNGENNEFGEHIRELNNRKHGSNIKSFQDDKLIDNYDIEETKHKRPSTEETSTPNTNANTIEVLMKIMKTVAETISRNSHRSINSKLRYLHELKNNILDNIENRIDSIWPDDDPDTVLQNGAIRRARSAHDAARGHVEFPSSESALMTISFLTFAVFLIKLVLQVIQTYKSKAMMVAPLVVATAGRATIQRLQVNNKENN